MCGPLALIPSTTKERREIRRKRRRGRRKEKRRGGGRGVLKSDHKNTYLACMRYQGPSPSKVGWGKERRMDEVTQSEKASNKNKFQARHSGSCLQSQDT